MDRFETALEFTLRWEGGYVDDPADPGGATNQGVTARVYNRFRAKRGLPMRPVSQIGPTEVRAIYLEDYWHRGFCDRLPPPVDVVHFDNTVNLGRPVQLLQAVAGVQIDGILGDVTLRAVWEHAPHELAESLCWARMGYHVFSLSRPKNVRFIHGWLNRTRALLALVKGGGGE